MADLTDDQARLFRDTNFAHLATIRPDGTPQVTPVWVDWDDGHIVLNTAKGRQKEQNLRRDPRLTIEVTSHLNPYQYVSVRGKAEFVDEGADEMIDKLAKKYMDVDQYPFRQEGEQRVTIRIRPEQVDASGF
jgi:PPOX class probable F420-dependent enzyme